MTYAKKAKIASLPTVTGTDSWTPVRVLNLPGIESAESAFFTLILANFGQFFFFFGGSGGGGVTLECYVPFWWLSILKFFGLASLTDRRSVW